MSHRASMKITVQLVSILLLILYVASSTKAQTDEDLKRPYKFGFIIEMMQHRYETKDERGIIMGEYGFITADGWYLTTIYATDEEGRFKILGRKRERVGPPLPPYNEITTVAPKEHTKQKPARGERVRLEPTTAPPPSIPTTINTTPGRRKAKFKGLNGCGSCIVPTTAEPGGVSNEDVNPEDQERPESEKIDDKAFVTPSSAIKEKDNQNRRINASRNGNNIKSERVRQRTGRRRDPLSPPVTTPERISDRSPPNERPTTEKSLPESPDKALHEHKPPSTSGLKRPAVSREDSDKPNEVPAGYLNYKFNYTLGYHGHHETGFYNGTKLGDYFFNSRRGKGHQVVYEANEFGYQPNITIVDLDPTKTPKEETEKDAGLQGYEFIWFK